MAQDSSGATADLALAEEIARLREIQSQFAFILKPLQEVPPDQLYRVAARLKDMGGGEYEACHRTLWRAIEHLYGVHQADSKETPALGIDTAYGSMTFPL